MNSARGQYPLVLARASCPFAPRPFGRKQETRLALDTQAVLEVCALSVVPSERHRASIKNLRFQRHAMALNEVKLNEFVGKVVGDLGAALHAALVVIGEKHGLFKAMADGRPVTSVELSQRTETSERY